MMRSDTDDSGEITNLIIGETIEIKAEERHRLIGQSEWSIVAEIWQHTDSKDPSDENDIVRVQDDFARAS
jgi:mannose-6-phosphate isomerase